MKKMEGNMCLLEGKGCFGGKLEDFFFWRKQEGIDISVD
jgi:hypothetical protein